MTTTTRTVTPGAPKDQNASGTIFDRKPKGRKYTFIMGGPSYAEAHKFINWEGVESNGNWVFWAGEEGIYQVFAEGFYVYDTLLKVVSNDAYGRRDNAQAHADLCSHAKGNPGRYTVVDRAERLALVSQS